MSSVYVIVSLDKAEGVINDIAVFSNKDDALDGMDEVAAEMVNATEILEEQEDGQNRCVRVFDDVFDCELYEREIV